MFAEDDKQCLKPFRIVKQINLLIAIELYREGLSDLVSE